MSHSKFSWVTFEFILIESELSSIVIQDDDQMKGLNT